ncbi:MAG: hypothetical protein ACXW6T_23635, partial [Candidatus Binatia bacterium]
EVMTRCFPPLARRRQYFLLILAKMANAGAASVQAPFNQGKTIQEGHQNARRCGCPNEDNIRD